MGKLDLISLPWTDAREQNWGEIVRFCVAEKIPDYLEKIFPLWEEEYPESTLPSFFKAVVSFSNNDVEQTRKWLDDFAQAGGDTLYASAFNYYLRSKEKSSPATGPTYEKGFTTGAEQRRFFSALGEILWTAGSLNEAVKFFRKALVLKQDDPRLWSVLTYLFIKLRDYDSAKNTIKMAEKYAESDSDLMIAAPYYAVFGDYQRAIEIYESVDIEKIVSPHHLINAGLVFFRTGDLDKAEKYWGRAVELNEHNAFAHYNLACIYTAREDFERAWEHFKISAQYSFYFFEGIKVDHDIQPLANHPEYKDKIAQLEKELRK